MILFVHLKLVPAIFLQSIKSSLKIFTKNVQMKRNSLLSFVINYLHNILYAADFEGKKRYCNIYLIIRPSWLVSVVICTNISEK
jgi:hypothetical protein